MIYEIDGIQVEVIQKRIKSINVRVYPPDGLVKMSVPMSFSKKLILSHLQDRLSWIHEKRHYIKAQDKPKPALFETGSTIPFKGESYLLIVIEHQGSSQIRIQDNLIQCYTKPNKASSKCIEALIENWYRREMELVIPPLIIHWQEIIGVKVNQWMIRKMQTLWGSCNPSIAKICLNLNLIKKNPLCLEYVLVHELLHLLEPSHNQRFYSLMKQVMPAWKDHHFLLEGRIPATAENMSF